MAKGTRKYFRESSVYVTLKLSRKPHSMHKVFIGASKIMISMKTLSQWLGTIHKFKLYVATH